jgi:hypothetical protein
MKDYNYMLQIIGNASHIRISCNWLLKSLHQYMKQCLNHCKLLIKTLATTSTYTFNEISNKTHTLQQEVKEVTIITCHSNQSSELLIYRSRVWPILRARRWCHGRLCGWPRGRQLQRVENGEADASSTQGRSSLDPKWRHHRKRPCFCVDLCVGSLPMVRSLATTSMMGVLRWCDLKWQWGWMISIDGCMGHSQSINSARLCCPRPLPHVPR